MKYFTNLFMFLAWYLEKISDINATNITQKEEIQKPLLFETWRSDVILAHIMIALKRNILILFEQNAYIIHSENTTRIFKIEGINIEYPYSIVEAPDGAFDVPSVTVTGKGKISQLDVSDPMKPTIANVLAIDKTYYCHDWINNNEFLGGSNDELSLVEIKNKGEAKEWNRNTVSLGQYRNLVLHQYAVYASSKKQIEIIWPEDAAGKPGDWRNENHIKKSYIDCESCFLTTADVNNDGKTDLLVSTQFEKEIDGEMKRHFEVRAYEIPEEFKNSDKYTEHVLISSVSFSPYMVLCVKQLKAFTPFTSSKGKPWILVSHFYCGVASYLQPESEEVGNWNYKLIKFLSNVTAVYGIEVADFNQDDYTELYILADRLHEYSFSNVTVTDPPSTLSSLPDPPSTLSSLPDPPSTPLRSAPSSSSIFYLDSTLLMFIWLFL